MDREAQVCFEGNVSLPFYLSAFRSCHLACHCADKKAKEGQLVCDWL